ncbi:MULTISPECIES: hypothetical protein [unclassified Oscillibacter]|uniref:hypothetical protein n=1 Tax=unclassified Oscillibacter TaxID=2629304 RepID=UPI0025D476BB|nr:MULTISPECIES: hypothetical protein [unclassified Oscillibacter]
MITFPGKEEEFPKYYTIIFNAVTDALKELDAGNPGKAKALLIRSQQEAEEAFLSVFEGPEDS